MRAPLLSVSFEVLSQCVLVLRLRILAGTAHKCAEQVPAPMEPQTGTAVRGNVPFLRRTCSADANPVIRL